MSTTAQTDAQTPDTKSASLSTQVSEFLASKPFDDNGKIIFGDDAPEAFKELVRAEKSRRDTQAAYTKQQQAIKKLEAEKEALLEQVNGAVTLTPEQQEELDELKFSDPDAWYQKKVALETQARQEAKAKLDQAGLNAAQAYELQRRKEVLAEFTQNTGFALTDEIIANDVPPRLTKKLEDGMEFGAWLYEVKQYLDTPKAIQKEDVSNVTDIGKEANASDGDKNNTGDKSLDDLYAGAVI
jgi:hypothetical protein